MKSIQFARSQVEDHSAYFEKSDAVKRKLYSDTVVKAWEDADTTPRLDSNGEVESVFKSKIPSEMASSFVHSSINSLNMQSRRKLLYSTI